MSNREIIPRLIREKVISKYAGRCAYCGDRSSKIIIDHIFPYRRKHQFDGDINSIDNLNPACPSCNNFKMAWTIEEFRDELSKQVDRGLRQNVNFRLAMRFGLVKQVEYGVVFYFEKGI
jgi:5-methylcytosine-specific restriction endonuclease McrA